MTTTTSDRFVEALARLNRYAESRPERRARPPVSIAVSRQAGSRGAEVARAVGAKLGWPVYDQELLQRIADEKGIQARLLELLDERHMGWLEEMIASFCIDQGSYENSYLRSLLQLFATLGEAGHCIIVGRGAPHVLPAETTLRVRFVAPRDFRIAQVQRSRGLSREEAEKWVDRTERERKRFIEHYFRKDPEDPLNYDLVLNTGRLSIATCVEVVAQAAQALEPAA